MERYTDNGEVACEHEFRLGLCRICCAPETDADVGRAIRALDDEMTVEEMAALGITEKVLDTLRWEADAHGDDKQYRLCLYASFGKRWAVVECARVIAAAKAMGD